MLVYMSHRTVLSDVIIFLIHQLWIVAVYYGTIVDVPVLWCSKLIALCSGWGHGDRTWQLSLESEIIPREQIKLLD